MTQSVLESMARAMALSRNMNLLDPPKVRSDLAADGVTIRDIYAARAALIALRDGVTGHMILAGLQELPFGPSNPDHSARCLKAMLNHVLQEGEK